jgi:predicted nucleic acid-binding protein
MNANLPETLFLPSLVLAEIRYGVMRLPDGRRREQLHDDIEHFLQAGFGTRVIPFDAACADGYAAARAARQRAGRPVTMADALIGGMALAYGATLATRNVVDFDGYGVSLINPWEADN